MSRAVGVLRAVTDRNRAGATATEIAQSAHLTTPTTHHLLNTLVDEGLLAKHNRRYYLGPLAGLMSETLIRDESPPPYLMPPLRGLAAATGETVYLSGWRRGEVVVLAALASSQAVMVGGPMIGFSGSAHARASGKVLLATLDDADLAAYLEEHPVEPLTPRTLRSTSAVVRAVRKVRDQGFATEEEEFREGVSCLAVPIAAHGTTVGAYTVAAPSERFQRLRDSYLAAARAAAVEALAVADDERSSTRG